MPNHYIDTHCHLTDRRLTGNLSRVLAESAAAGVIGVLAVAASLDSSGLCVEIAEKYPSVLASVGVHPNDAGELDDEKWKEIAQLAEHPRVAAIGETGLDYHWEYTPHDVQKKWFEKHIELSLATGKPLSIHARNSVGDMLDMIKPHLGNGLKAIWHCFVASRREIRPALDFTIANGVYLALGGVVTFEDQKPLREVAHLIPDELLLLETDAPYLVPRPKKVNTNTPMGVVRVAEVLAELRETTPEHIAKVTTENARNLLGFE